MKARKIILPFFLILLLGLIIAGSMLGTGFFGRQDWGLLSAEILFILLVLFFWVFEEGKTSAREIALIAVLGAVAAVGRIPFAALPNVQPATFVVIVSGFVLGPRAGFMVGSTAALVSNFFLGQGPWTPWQMFAWGLAGSSAGVLKYVFPGTGSKGMIVFNFIWGYLFGWMMNLWFWTAFTHPPNWKTFLATCAASFWFDTFHALGNALFCIVFGTGLIKILKRMQRKLTVEDIADLT
mgnify:CR=1 FL=1